VTCPTCASTVAAVLRYRIVNGESVGTCDMCSNVRASDGALPDVYLGSGGGIKYDEHLAWGHTGNKAVDDRCEGKPIPYSTKREKALAMKLAGVRQADSAERQRGARNESHLHRRTYFI